MQFDCTNEKKTKKKKDSRDRERVRDHEDKAKSVSTSDEHVKLRKSENKHKKEKKVKKKSKHRHKKSKSATSSSSCASSDYDLCNETELQPNYMLVNTSNAPSQLDSTNLFAIDFSRLTSSQAAADNSTLDEFDTLRASVPLNSQFITSFKSTITPCNFLRAREDEDAEELTDEGSDVAAISPDVLSVDLTTLLENAQQNHTPSASLALELHNTHYVNIPKVPGESTVNAFALYHTNIPFQKNIYTPANEVLSWTEDRIKLLRATYHININKSDGELIGNVIADFEHCGFDVNVLSYLRARGLQKPLIVQQFVIPAILSGKDVLCVAPTGSGKTLSYILPIVRHCKFHNQLHPLKSGDGPLALVLTPTRELAQQVSQEANSIAILMNLKCMGIFGGTDLSLEVAKLREQVHILVATPGRLIDAASKLKHHKSGDSKSISYLRRVVAVVMDEGDRLLDMGFASQVALALSGVRQDRITCMFSATMPNLVRQFASRFLNKDTLVALSMNTYLPSDARNASSLICNIGKIAINSNIVQCVELVDNESAKLPRLLKLLGEWQPHGAAIIFTRTQSNSDALNGLLRSCGYVALVAHSGMNQVDRDGAISDFKANISSILIATSVVARGLDVPHVKLVVNYDCPEDIEEYVHKIGRTGRNQAIGVAYTFIVDNSNEELEIAAALTPLIKEFSECDRAIDERLEQRVDTYMTGIKSNPDELKAFRRRMRLKSVRGRGLQHFNDSKDHIIEIQKAVDIEDIESSEDDHME